MPEFSASEARFVGDGGGDDVAGAHPLLAETVQDGDQVALFVRGELDIATSPALLHRLLELAKLPVQSLTLDLAELSFIDSSGLAVLNNARVGAEDAGVAFALSSLPAQARRVLELTDMLSLFTLRDDAGVPTPASWPRPSRD